MATNGVTVFDLAPATRATLTVFPLAPAAAYGVDAFVTGRAGGVSAAPYDTLNLGDHVGDDEQLVTENRRRVAEAAGVEPSALLIIHQVHGNGVLESHEATASSEGDALLGGEDDRALAMLVADCVPLVLIEPRARRFVVVHAGWRGLVAGVLEHALSRLGRAAGLRAILGPSISGAAYQIGPDVARYFRDCGSALSLERDGHYWLDLREVAVQRLLAGGLVPSEVYVTREVTDGATTFFSDRAQRPCGRFALVAKRSS